MTIEHKDNLEHLIPPWSEDLGQIKKNGQAFHMHRDGTPAYEARYDRVDIFINGKAWVQKDGEWFRIRPDGTRAD